MRSEPPNTSPARFWSASQSHHAFGEPTPLALDSSAETSGTTSMLDANFSAFFDDAANQKFLADLLGESNVDTNDPFAFLTSEGWEDLTY